VLGCLTLRWPFTADGAVCENAQVLARVAALLPAHWLPQAVETNVTSPTIIIPQPEAERGCD